MRRVTRIGSGPYGVMQATDRQHLEREHRAGQRRAEHRAEAGRDAAHQQHRALLARLLEGARELVGQRAAHLHRRAFAPDRGAEQVRDDGRQQHQWRHAQRQRLAWLVDLVDQQVVAAVRAATELEIGPADRKARQRQTGQQPGLGQARGSGPVERVQEQRRGAACEQRDRDGQQQPASERAQAGDSVGAGMGSIWFHGQVPILSAAPLDRSRCAPENSPLQRHQPT